MGHGVPSFSTRDTLLDCFLLIGWAGLIIACTSLHPSFMAHDEGNFAAEARFMSESGRWLARLWWDRPVFTHGVLLNWLMVLSYKVFGMSIWAARLPSAIASITAILLTYDISRTITGKRFLGFLTAAVLTVFHLWFQFSHLATQDMLLVCLELLGIWGLLKAEAYPSQRVGWGFLSGIILGLGFLTKSFMILLPAVAIAPYLIFENRRHRHLTNPGLYIGVFAGLALVGLWLWASIAQYGDEVLRSLFGKISELGEEAFHASDGPLYYFWNIPANAFPWPLFSLIGVGFCWRERKAYNPYRWLLIYPFILFGMLTSFATRTPYYTLQLFPFLALFSAIALHRLAFQPSQWPRRWLSFAFSALGLILFLLGLSVLLSLPLFSESLLVEIRPYAPVAIVLGLGWCALLFTQAEPTRWLAAWLLPVWLTLGATGISGLYGDYSPELLADLAQPSVANVVSAQPVDFIVGDDWSDTDAHKTLVLLSFYTPQLGNYWRELPGDELRSYAWLAPNVDGDEMSAIAPYEEVGRVQQFKLVRLVP